MSARMDRQLSFDDLGDDLRDVTFVVVDLETTGTHPAHDRITEIGAVKARGGEILGHFQTLVDPQAPIPAFVARLTGIGDETVRDAPRIETVLPMFLEFAHDTVLVAHNARFDIGFLTASAARLDLTWPGPTVVDTVALARRLVGHDEVRNYKLSTLAAYFNAHVTPDHRALSDARATVDVLDALIARLGDRGLTTLQDLTGLHAPVKPVQRQKKSLAAGLPHGPGVYRFVDAQERPLYVGKSQDVATRVRSYFTPAEKRRHVIDMLHAAEAVRVVPCATELEAAIRELRMIADLSPAYNRRSRRPTRVPWLKLEPHGPLLRCARAVHDDESLGGAYIGPLTSRHDADRLRSLLVRTVIGPDALLQASARHGSDPQIRARLRAAMLEDPAPVLDAAAARIAEYGAHQRYEQAAELRDDIACYLTCARRASALRALSACEGITAARPIDGRWEIVHIRRGRLASVGCAERVENVVRIARSVRATADSLEGMTAPLCGGYHEEAELILHWLEADDARLVDVEGTWAMTSPAAFSAEGLKQALRELSPA